MQPSYIVKTQNSYPIFVENNKWQDFLQSQPSAIALVDENIVKYHPTISQFCQHLIIIPSGEASKSRQIKAEIEDQLFDIGANRSSTIIAIGGGVALDLSSFIAATFCRGIDIYSLPTSLLAMVDVCIGGKNGINTTYGKNTIGTFYHPKAVMIDSSFLSTLPVSELLGGLVESFKHGLILDGAFFTWQQQYLNQIIRLDESVLPHLLLKNIQIKATIVAQDENDHGIRQILNYGHTIGHALETVSRYQISHGKAVAIGIMTENYIAQKLGILDVATADQINQTIFQLNSIDDFSSLELNEDAMLSAIYHDKKCMNRNVHMVLLETIGKTHIFNQNYTTTISESILRSAVKWLQQSIKRGFSQYRKSIH